MCRKYFSNENPRNISCAILKRESEKWIKAEILYKKPIWRILWINENNPKKIKAYWTLIIKWKCDFYHSIQSASECQPIKQPNRIIEFWRKYELKTIQIDTRSSWWNKSNKVTKATTKTKSTKKSVIESSIKSSDSWHNK